MNITVLVENSAPQGLAAEHGLSFFVEYRGHRLLLDGGATDVAARNARTLGIDLSGVELAVLSHGHYDHGDGLPALLAGLDAPVYLRTQALAAHYHANDPNSRYIGLSEAAKAALSPKVRPVEGVTPLFPGGWLFPDRVDHEQSLVLEGTEGLVVLNSCCHAGAGHIIRDVKGQFPEKPVAALVGGLHLMGAAGPESLGVAPGIVQNLGRWLFDELEVGAVYTGHCTGSPAFELLKKGHPQRVRPLTAGLTLTFAD